MNNNARKLVLTDVTEQSQAKETVLTPQELKNIMQHGNYENIVKILEILTSNFHDIPKATDWLMERISETSVKSIHVELAKNKKILIRVRF